MVETWWLVSGGWVAWWLGWWVGEGPRNRGLESIVRAKHPYTDAGNPWSDPSIRIRMLGIRGPIQAPVYRYLESVVRDQGNQASVYRCLDRTKETKHL